MNHPVSHDSDYETRDPEAGNGAVADLKPRMGALQIGAGDDMIMDAYDVVDEKQDVAIITPEGSSDEPELISQADDYEAMIPRVLSEYPDLEIESEAVHTWHIEDWRNLERKQRGPKFTCGGYPWRVLLFPYGNNVDYASFYLEQGFDDDDEPPPEDWYACVQFALVLWNKHDPSIFALHTANHRFNAEESDWGFTRFAEIRKLFASQWEDRGRPMVEDDAVNVTAYVRVYKDPTGVLWHNFVNYDSKKETGMVGLKNQGATCYLNSLLQSLYFTNAFRKAVYQIPTEHEAEKSNSAWTLQRLFYLLQTSKDAVATAELTASFGWETRHIFEQQDIQELSRILMDRLEGRMKGTEAENALPKMFVGSMKTYMSCINVDYESSRIEDFWDIQLNVSGNRSLDDSFRDYVQVETMDGENKYFAEGYGLQDARKGVIFESFPQVLHLQLKRFEYDISRDAMMKVNDRYEFPEIFDASPYLSENADRSESYIYKLHGVLVHSGDLTAGHYYAFLKPKADGHFYRFDDDRVTRATLKEALEENFGGDYGTLVSGNTPHRNPYTRTMSTKRSMSAYMLVYIRQSREQEILVDVEESDTPSHLAKQLNEEREALERRRKEREEAHLYMNVTVIDDDSFNSYQGFDLSSPELDPSSEAGPKTHRIRKTTPVGELTEFLADLKGVSSVCTRLWAMVNRQNKTVRPDTPLSSPAMTVEEAFIKAGSRDKGYRLWLEVAEHVESGKPVWPDVLFNSTNNPSVLIFLKYFNIEAQTLKGSGHVYLRKNSKVGDIIPMVQKIMGLSSRRPSNETEPGITSSQAPNGLSSPPAVALYEEIKFSMIEPMKPKATLQQAELQDGDIVCFQRAVSDKEALAISQSDAYPNAQEFYDYLLNRVVITFQPRFSDTAGAEIFELPLSKRMSYDQFSAKVGEHLGANPTHIRFLTINATTGKPKAILQRQMNQTLVNVLYPSFGTYANSNQRSDRLFYEVLEMSLSEMENKKCIKITWVSEGVTKEEMFDVLVPKTGTVGDIVPALQKKANIADDVIRHVRIYEAHNGKMYRELPEDFGVTSITEYTYLYAEVIPEEEHNAGESDKAIYAYHFDKDTNKPHGVPFKFLVKPGEPFKDTKERLSKRIGIKGKQFDKIKFAIIPRSSYSKPIYLNDDDDLAAVAQSRDDHLGLDHVNKTRVLGDSIFIR